jgi:hypothetical protein
MSGIQFPQEVVPGFDLQIQEEGGKVHVQCGGSVDTLDPVSTLQPELLNLHKALLAQRATSVRLEMQSVEYMNSSGIKCFMAWFLKAEQTKGGYSIEVIYDPEVTWQYVSFTTMGRIAPRVLRMTPLQKARG